MTRVEFEICILLEGEVDDIAIATNEIGDFINEKSKGFYMLKQREVDENGKRIFEEGFKLPKPKDRWKK